MTGTAETQEYKDRRNNAVVAFLLYLNGGPALTEDEEDLLVLTFESYIESRTEALVLQLVTGEAHGSS